MDLTPPEIKNCQKADIESYLKNAYNLKKNEFPVILYLLNSKTEKTVKEISDGLSKERSTIQKIISGLLKKQIILQRQKNLKKGGFLYNYSIKDKENFHKEIK